MGIALIIPSVDFSGASLGQVTPFIPTPLESLAITGPDSIAAPATQQYSVAYTPATTTETGVTWSLTAGGSIASIDPNGLLTVTGTGFVTIRATSSVNQSIYTEKSINATYIPLEDLTDRLNFPRSGGYYVTGITLEQGDYIKIKFARITSNSICFYVGSRKLSNADDDTISIESDKNLKVFVKLFGTKYTSENALTTGTRYVITAKQSGVTCTPSLGNFTPTTYTYTQGYPLCIDGILYANNSVGYNGGAGDIFGIEIYGSDDTLKHRLIPQSDLTWLDEITNITYSKTGGGTVNFGTD